MSFNLAAQSLDLNADDIVFFCNSHSDFMLAAKELSHDILNSVMKCWTEYLDENFGDVWHCLNPSSEIIVESGYDKDYKHHHETNAASSELDDLHR